MKRLTVQSSAVLLSVSLLMPISPVFAATTMQAAAAVKDMSSVKLSKAEALAIAEKFAKPSADLTLTSTSFHGGDLLSQMAEWTFQWRSKDAEKRGESEFINVGVDADTGDITNYHISSPEQEQANSHLSRDEAQKICETFIAKATPNKWKQVKLYSGDQPEPKTPLGKNVMYSYRYARVVNDILFPDNDINITVTDSGKVVRFELNWNKQVEFEQSTAKISVDEAKKLFANPSVFKPSYLLPWDERRKDSIPFLVYNNPLQFYFDANTGKKFFASSQTQPLKDPEPISKKSLAPHHKGKPITQDEAIKIVEKNMNLKGYKLQSASYEEGKDGERPVWDLWFTSGESGKKSNRDANFNIDASTGDITNFWIDRESNSGTKTKLTDEEAKQTAILSLQKFLPSMADQLYLSSFASRGKDDPDRLETEFNFQRYINGIPAASGEGNIRINLATGEITQLNYRLGTETYPASLPKMLSSKEAMEAWLKETKVELNYVIDAIPEGEKQAISRPAKAEKKIAHLVYRATATPIDRPYALNAETGDWINLNNGQPITLHMAAPTDLKEHPAAKELMVMYEYEAISLVDGKIMPDKQITRGEMIKMMVNTLNQGYGYAERYGLSRKNSFADVSNTSPYFAAVEAAIDTGLLDKSEQNLNPDELITKEELAVLFTRAFGYKKLSQYSSLFKTDISDIKNDKNRGAVAIVTTLGIMDAKNNSFQPQANVTRANAAIAFFKFMQKKNELDEGQPPMHIY